MKVIPLDTRLLKMLVFLFQVEEMHDPPDHALYDDTVQAGPNGTGWIWEAGPAAVVWDNGLDASYWESLPNSRRTVITVTQQDTTDVPWFSIKAEAAIRHKYPVTCKSHKCMKVLTLLPTNVHLHTLDPIQPEILDAIEEMLHEMLADTAPATIRTPPVPLLPRTYLHPNPEPGYHLHTLPGLATVAGEVTSTDAGTPGVKERAKARGGRNDP